MPPSFVELAFKAFNYLLTDFSFSLTEKSSDSVKFTSKHCYVVVYLERSVVELEVGALMDIPELKAGMSKEFSLQEILNFLVPQMNFKYFIPNTIQDPPEIERELTRLSNLFLKYCRPIIEGNLSIWPELNKYRRAIWEALSKK